MLSRVMADNVLMAAASKQLRLRAEIASTTLVASGEIAFIDLNDVNGNSDADHEAMLYDALVPIFFR